jgi:hypothetical protein
VVILTGWARRVSRHDPLNGEKGIASRGMRKQESREEHEKNSLDTSGREWMKQKPQEQTKPPHISYLCFLKVEREVNT